jgi:hypothetical protein
VNGDRQHVASAAMGSDIVSSRIIRDLAKERGDTAATKDALIESLDRAARDMLAYFAGPGRTTSARVDQWHARDVLLHCIARL